jgi:hypothetical protein
VPAFFILDRLLPRIVLLTLAAIPLEKGAGRINSVDGFHAALEIDSRSSYVPNLTVGV